MKMIKTNFLSSHRESALQLAITTLNQIILGKEEQIKLAVCCLVAKGHLLIEDVPGVGKTTLALALSKTFGLQFQRVQFTSDLLPADLLGVSVYNKTSGHFDFHPGPIFCQLLLADEINRSTPKTQSALLEAMEERQASIDGKTHILANPFFVIATQNPQQQIGTFPLPESQLDRFLMRIEMGYPGTQAERELLGGTDRREYIDSIPANITAETLLNLQGALDGITTSPPLIDYILALVHASRLSPWFSTGLSPRAGLALKRAAQAWAMVAGRDYVLPEDVQQVFPAVSAHRIVVHPEFQGQDINSLVGKLIETVPV